MLNNLTRDQIDQALTDAAQGIEQYLWLQQRVGGNDTWHDDPEFRRKFNHFYRVRRDSAWRDIFYGLMGRARREQLNFEQVLHWLIAETHRYEASFASKLIATINPSKPVIDSIVLKNLELRLPSSSVSNRAKRICDIYGELEKRIQSFLATPNGGFLVAQFKRVYPGVDITPVKMVDFVLWKIRDNPTK
jgi:hypothetical protein